MHAPTLSFYTLNANIEEITYAKSNKGKDPVAGIFFNIFYTYNSPAGLFLRTLYSFEKRYKEKRYSEVLSNTLETLSYNLSLAKTCCSIARGRLFNPESQFVSETGMEQLDLIMRLAPLCRNVLQWQEAPCETIVNTCKTICTYQETLGVTYSTSFYPPMDALINTACGYGCIADQYSALEAYFSRIKETQGSLRPFFHSLYRWYQEWKLLPQVGEKLLEYASVVQLLCEAAPSFFHQEDPHQISLISSIKKERSVFVANASYQVETFYDFSVKIDEEHNASYTIFHLNECPRALFVPSSPAYTFLLLKPFTTSFANTPPFFPCAEVLLQDPFGQWAFLDKNFPLIPHFTSVDCPSSVKSAVIGAISSWVKNKSMPFPIPKTLALHSEQNLIVSYPHLSTLKTFSLKDTEQFLFDLSEGSLLQLKQWLLQLHDFSEELAFADLCIRAIFNGKWMNQTPKITKTMRSSIFLEEATNCCKLFFQVLDQKIYAYKPRLTSAEKNNAFHHYLSSLYEYMRTSRCSFYIPEETLEIFAREALEKREEALQLTNIAPLSA